VESFLYQTGIYCFFPLFPQFSVVSVVQILAGMAVLYRILYILRGLGDSGRYPALLFFTFQDLARLLAAGFHDLVDDHALSAFCHSHRSEKTVEQNQVERRNVRRAVIAGAGDLGVNLVKEVESMPWAALKSLVFDDKIDEEDLDQVMGKPILGNIAEIPPISAKTISITSISPCRCGPRKNLHHPQGNADHWGTSISFRIYVFGLHHAEISHSANCSSSTSIPIRVEAVLISSSPLWSAPHPTAHLPIAMLIYLDDGGRFSYRHRRITAAGKEFDCIKFRTMRVRRGPGTGQAAGPESGVEKEWERTYKLKNDPRITRIGRLLRRTQSG
jgi:hypothetical protein